jgi:hypothetical protein
MRTTEYPFQEPLPTAVTDLDEEMSQPLALYEEF